MEEKTLQPSAEGNKPQITKAKTSVKKDKAKKTSTKKTTAE